MRRVPKGRHKHLRRQLGFPRQIDSPLGRFEASIEKPSFSRSPFQSVPGRKFSGAHFLSLAAPWRRLRRVLISHSLYYVVT
jgi:hypothetical protein